MAIRKELCENAFAFALNQESLLGYCHNCLASTSETKINACTGCYVIKYCSKSCQQRDWRYHKPECHAYRVCSAASFSRVQDGDDDCGGDDIIRLVLRLAVRWANGEFLDADDHVVVQDRRGVDLPQRRLDELMTPRSILMAEQTLERFEAFTKSRIVGRAVIKRLICIVNVNSIALFDEYNTPIGTALCLRLSGVDHSCKPNTRVLYRNRQCILAPCYADGFQNGVPYHAARHAYIDPLQPREKRKAILKDRYNFRCECEGCLDEERTFRMEAFACEECLAPIGRNVGDLCTGPTPHPLTQQAYDTCNMVVASVEDINAQYVKTNLPNELLEKLTNGAISLMDGCLAELNVLRVPTYKCLFKVAVSDKKHDEAVFFGRKLLNIQKAFLGEYDVFLLNTEYALVQTLISTGINLDFAVRLLEKQRLVNAIYRGPTSALYRSAEIVLSRIRKDRPKETESSGSDTSPQKKAPEKPQLSKKQLQKQKKKAAKR